MARARLLKPGFFSNEDMSPVPAFGRLLFAGLWTLADRRGRMDDRPKRIKAELFPYDPDVPVAELLDLLEENGFIQRYAVGDWKLIQIINFEKHQHPHKNEPESVIPGPPKSETSANVRSPSDIGGSQPAIVGSAPAVAKAEANTEAKAEANADGAAEPPPEPPAHPFCFTYVRRYQHSHAGRPPPQTEQAAALAIERQFGSDACIQLGNDLDWSKHPNYMRPILEERANGHANGANSRQSAAAASADRVAVGVSDLERRRAAVAERRRVGVT